MDGDKQRTVKQIFSISAGLTFVSCKQIEQKISSSEGKISLPHKTQVLLIFNAPY